MTATKKNDLPIAQMVADATALAAMKGNCVGVIRDMLGADVCCHVKALAAEYERLRLFEQAMQSMAAQILCPKTSAEELARRQLRFDVTRDADQE